MANEDVPAYIAKKECGCIIGTIVDDGKFPKEVAKALKEWVLDGYIIERTTVGYVRQHFGECEKHKPKKQLTLSC